MEITILGSEQFVTGFMLAGIRNYRVAETKEEYERTLEALLVDSSVGILVLSEDEVKRLSTGWQRRLMEVVEPVIISIGKTGDEDLREKIKRAIGVDLYKEKE